ncbi:hypothetical protein Nepgr_006954 [Nepenthes gracilis]|uniref:Uncharacterized protein n=1 Tax=Nepenthes gracilis TaxID=150966 RepID=A0AAD3XHV9_NEPGR|nr:hypothetical protein Nepgr_006954 [Nepenthes gracilis]
MAIGVLMMLSFTFLLEIIMMLDINNLTQFLCKRTPTQRPPDSPRQSNQISDDFTENSNEASGSSDTAEHGIGPSSDDTSTSIQIPIRRSQRIKMAPQYLQEFRRQQVHCSGFEELTRVVNSGFKLESWYHGTIGGPAQHEVRVGAGTGGGRRLVGSLTGQRLVWLGGRWLASSLQR